MELTQTQYTVSELLPASSSQIAENLGVTQSYARDIIADMRAKGKEVQRDDLGRYYIPGETEMASAEGAAANVQRGGDSKSQITRRINDILTEWEYEIKADLQHLQPVTSEVGHPYTDGGTDIIFHRTDDHFGHEEIGPGGEPIFNSDIAEEYVVQYFDKGIEYANMREKAGAEIENANALLGGDMLTNDSTYENQVSDVDGDMTEQIKRVTDVYFRQIRKLSERFPTLRVVCQGGNHGEVSGSDSNADDIIYDNLEKLVAVSDMDNVTFMQTESSYYMDFEVRDWNVHLRHGHDASLEHIGTSAGRERWLTWLVDHGFDVAFRGHYHMLKEEPISGRPVVMGGSLQPQTEFEESHALSGRPAGAVHGVTDDQPLAWSERIYFTDG